MSTISYIPEYQVVLSRRCPYACGYCNFPNTPSPPLPSGKQLRKYLRLAARLRATQITLTAGEDSQAVVEVHNTCRYYGYDNWGEYLRAMCSIVLNYESPRVLFPVIDVGRLPYQLLRDVANVAAGVRLLVDTADESLSATLAHDNAPQKTLESRMAGLEELGRLRIPAFTGTRVGIGESESSWAAVAERINIVHRRYRNVASFAVLPFRPLPFTPMAFLPGVPPDQLQKAVKVIRSELDKHIPVCVEIPETPIDPRTYLESSLTDIGIVRVGSNEKINIDVSHLLGELNLHVMNRGDKLNERLPWMNKFIRSYELCPAIRRNLELYTERWRELPKNEEDSNASITTPPGMRNLRPGM